MRTIQTPPSRPSTMCTVDGQKLKGGPVLAGFFRSGRFRIYIAFTYTMSTVDSQKLQCRSRSNGFFRGSRPGSILPSYTLFVQSIVINYGVDPDRLASSEVADQDLYWGIYITFTYTICTVNDI